MGSTYTRQSTFTDGDTITADLFNTEFDQLVAAFAATSGHSHDGTAGEGGPIGGLITPGITLGDNTIDVTLTFDGGSNDGVLKWMEDEDYFEFSDDILIASTEKLQFRDTAIYINSSADGQLDIVADTEIQIAATTIDINGNADISGNLGIGGNLTVTGTTTFNGGTITLGDAAADNVVFGADVDSHIIPDDDDTYDLGSASQEWRNLYIDGTAHIDTLDVDVNATVAGTLGVTGVLTGSSLDISGDIDVDGTTNLDAVDIDGAVQLDATLTVGANDQGYDVILYGDTASANMTWDTSADDLIFNGAAGLIVPDGQLTLGSTAVTSTAAELNLLDGVSGLVQADLTKLAAVDSTAAELNIMDGGTSATSTTVADADRVVMNDNGTMVQVAVTDLAAYFDDEITAMPNLVTTAATTVGALNSGSITSGFGTIDTGSSTITTTGLISGGSLDIDSVLINGTTIGHTDDTDLITLANGVVTVAGEVSMTTLDIGGTNVTSTAAELNILDGKAFLDEDNFASNSATGIASQQSIKAYVDGVTTTSITSTGALNSGSITSGFGTIDTGASTITTTGLISGGSLDIDNVLINGTTIGHTDDTDLITLADGVVTVAGEVSMTTLDIGGTNVTSTAAELNALDGITAVVGELNALDLGSTAVGTAIASKAVVLDSNKDYTGVRNFTITGNLSVGGTTTVVDTVTMNAQNAVLFEGATADAHETTLTIVDPTADRTINLPNQSGTIPVLAAASNTAVTSTPEELNILDGVTSTAAELNILDVSNSTIGDLSEISTAANDDVFIALDTSGGGLKKITRSSIIAGTGSSGDLANVVEDTSPQLGGNLDMNGADIVTTSNATIDLAPHGTGTVVVRGNTNSGTIVFNCEDNSHGQTLYGQPHSAGVTNTLMLPAGANSTLVSLVSTDTLTNKTLTSPKINEDVAVTSTATEINLLDGVTSTTAELNILDGVTSTAAELNALDGITAVVGELNALDLGSTAVGTAIASKAMVLDSNKDYTGVRNFTLSGELDAGSLDISGNADIDGTLETDALSINGTTVTSTAAELNILDGVTATAAEINLIDGGTARGTTAVADGDGVLINDAGTMRMTSVDTLSTYMSGKSVGGSSIVTTGALNSGSITSGFGNIDTGSSTITTTGLISGGSLDIDNVLINGTTIGHTDDTDLITVADGLVTVAGEVQMTTLDIGGTNVTSTAAELNVLDGITAVVGELNALDIGLTAVGTAVASKAMILDSNKDYTGVRNFTLSGELDAGSLDISGDADIDGTLEADAITIGGVSLAETISDTVGAMVSSNTESGITVAYQDADNTLDFTIGTLNQNTTGSAATLTTARAIAVAGDVTGTANFDGSAGISITTTLAADAIVTANITDGNVTVAKMAANSVDSAQYVDGSIDREHLAADIIDGTKIANDAINSEHYAAGSIDNEHIADNAINSEHYADGSIDRAHLAADIIDGTKIADDVINSEHYVAGSIDAEHLASDSVTEAKIAANSIDSQAYVDGSIDTAHIADNQITLAKMAGIARGKLIVGDSGGNPAVIGPGSNGQVLTSDGTDIAFADAAGGPAYTRAASAPGSPSAGDWWFNTNYNVLYIYDGTDGWITNADRGLGDGIYISPSTFSLIASNQGDIYSARFETEALMTADPSTTAVTHTYQPVDTDGTSVLASNTSGMQAVSNTTRGVLNMSKATTNGYVYLTLATRGAATAFGNAVVAINNGTACDHATRGIFVKGDQSQSDNSMEYITIASTGNATDFGNLTAARGYFGGQAVANTTRGVFSGGYAAAFSNVMDYVTILTAGNATDFGNLTAASYDNTTACSIVRGVIFGASNRAAIDYITIASTGNAADFGDHLTATLNGNSYVVHNRIYAYLAKSAGSIYQEKHTIATAANATSFIWSSMGSLGNAQQHCVMKGWIAASG